MKAQLTNISLLRLFLIFTCHNKKEQGLFSLFKILGRSREHLQTNILAFSYASTSSEIRFSSYTTAFKSLIDFLSDHSINHYLQPHLQFIQSKTSAPPVNLFYFFENQITDLVPKLIIIKFNIERLFQIL